MKSLEALAVELKQLIVESCERPVEPGSITNEELLFGPDARLALDSLDALQLSMAIQKRYGLRLTDSKETRRILSSVGNMAQVLETHLAAH
ncbi:MAG: phosphopantetheine-binding protein [Holophaga sp.]|nr:phosphopantetheine-binding protein [Holophaga sp.]